MSMFCYQCEQTARGTGCTVMGVCGKNESVAALQDLLVYATAGIAQYAHRARQLGMTDAEIDVFTVEALFTTVTNVNFSIERIVALLRRAGELKERARRLYEAAAGQTGQGTEELSGPARWQPADTIEGLIEQGRLIGIEPRRTARGEVLTGLEMLIIYGLKGTAAYADHAQILGQSDPAVYAFFHETLDFLTGDHDQPALLAKALRVGEMNLRVMELLDHANTGAYGHPEPTRVRVTPLKGKAILVSGHDLADLDALLRQTEGTGINVYTHGEMLPALAYPGLKKYKHLAGNYGGAWQHQQKEFAEFPGAILMTTNCIQKPRGAYQDRLFTSGLVAYPDVRHIHNREFGPVIEAARAAPGFAADEPEKTILIGFGRNAVLGVADKVVEAVKSGAIKHFLLVGGCDGAKSDRSYYTELAEQAPADTVILTLACGKYRFNQLDFGAIGGIPRLLDVGQCNDAYSAIQIALGLAKAFNTDVNSLPLSLVLSWYEQKAVAILLTLLFLGVRNIRLGPSLPAFVAPPVLRALVDNFGLKPVGSAVEDLKEIMARA